jgi:hypothetical protein
MTERDSDTGQSTAEEPRFGQEALEAKAGYVPFKDTTDADPEEGLTIDQPLRMIFRARSRKISKRTASAFPNVARRGWQRHAHNGAGPYVTMQDDVPVITPAGVEQTEIGD